MSTRLILQTLIAVLFVFANLLPVAQPTSALVAPPPLGAPATVEALVAPEASVSPRLTPPAPDALPAVAQEARVRQAAEAAVQKYADYYGPRYDLSIADVVIEGAWAYAVTQPQAPDGQPLYLLARMEGGAWQVATPKENERYEQWLVDAPSSLLNSAKKEELRASAAQAMSSGQNLESPDVSRPEAEMQRAPTIADPTPTPTPSARPTPRSTTACATPPRWPPPRASRRPSSTPSPRR